MNFVSSITLMFKDAFSSGFASAQNSFAGMKDALSTLNENQSMNRLAADLAMAAGLTEPFRRGLSAALDVPSQLAGAFESSMKNIQAITGLSSAEINTLGNELTAIGGGVAAGPLAVASAYTDVAGGITNVTAQMPVLQNAVALAEAGQADLGVATNGLVKIMNSYGFSVSNAATEAERIAEINGRAAWASDVLTQAVGMGVGSMNEFVTAMAPVSGMAASVGIGFDEVGSNMAYITSTIGSASEAGTMVSSLITALLKPNKYLTEILQSVGISSGSAMLSQYGLAESASILTRAVGGNQDALTQALGRQEAMKAAVQLSSGAYADFAAQFGSTMQGITAAAQAIQVEAYESKVGRLNAATDALKIQIGGDINAIKGFFVDMGAGFLSHVVSPIMSSPVGGVFQGIAAGVGLAAQSVLSLGSGALNTATQLVVMTATIQNAGGFSKLFRSSIGGIHSGLGLLATPLKVAGMQLAAFSASAKSVGFGQTLLSGIKGFGSGIAGLGKNIVGALPKMGAWIASTWAAAGAHLAAFWPVYAVIGGVALLALGATLLVKNWDAVSAFFVNLWDKVTGAFSAAFNWIKNLLAGVSNKVLVVISVFMPFIGIPALIIKNWSAVSAFFVKFWTGITSNKGLGIIAVFLPFIGIPALIIKNWGAVSAFFVKFWTGITSNKGLGIIAVFLPFIGIPALIIKNWSSVPAFFTGLWVRIREAFSAIWNGIVGVVSGVANWFGEVWAGVANFFMSVWNNITGAVSSVTNWFGEVWAAVAGTFASVWLWIKDLFTSIWESIKGVVLGFVEWLSPVIDAIIAPFKAIGNVIGGIINTVGGWFGDTVELGKSELARINENKAAAAVAKPVETMTTTAASAPVVTPATTPPAIVTTSGIEPPVMAAAGTAQTGAAAPAAGGGNSLLDEHLAAAARKGVGVGGIDRSASDAFMSAGATLAPAVNMPALDAAVPPVIDMSGYDNDTKVNFAEAMPPAQPQSVQTPAAKPETKPPKPEQRVIKIENLYLQSEDTLSILNFVRELEHLILKPVEAAV